MFSEIKVWSAFQSLGAPHMLLKNRTDYSVTLCIELAAGKVDVT
jgi:hypothetical protein